MTRRILAAVVVLVAVAVALGQNPFQRAADAVKDEKKAERLDVRLSNPTPQPDRIILTWKGDPTTSQAVTWRTDTSVTAAEAQIALADRGPGVEKGWKGYDSKKVTTVAARTELLKTAINVAHYHSVNFENLKPKTKYMYRVGDGKVWSEWFHFDTASTEPEPFGFIYFGDAQNGIKSLWSRIARGAYSDMPKAKFIVHAGDLVNSGPSDTEWGEWHTAAGWINGMVPSVPTPGNHEYSGSKGLTEHWRKQFTLPENGPPGLEEACYFLDFQGVRIISLDSNPRATFTAQAAWLENVLASRPPSIRWTVVTFHHPIYSTAKGRDNPQVRETWRPIFDRHAVDLVLQGHDHTYGRSGLMKEDNVLSGTQVHTERGTVYVVSVSGAKLYALGEQPWMANPNKGEGVQLYQLIRIDGDQLKYESRTASGELFDAFVLRKRPDGGNELLESDVPLLKDQERGPSRIYGNAVAALLILTTVGIGVAWAFKGRNGTNGHAA